VACCADGLTSFSGGGNLFSSRSIEVSWAKVLVAASSANKSTTVMFRQTEAKTVIILLYQIFVRAPSTNAFATCSTLNDC